jgi:hypothetical protein
VTEQRRSSHSKIFPRLGIIVLAIAPYCLVTLCGVSAVALVGRTAAQAVNTKFQSVIQGLNTLKTKRRP